MKFVGKLGKLILILQLFILLLFPTIGYAQNTEVEEWEERPLSVVANAVPFSHPALIKISNNEVYDLIIGQETGSLVFLSNLPESPTNFTLEDPETPIFVVDYPRGAPHVADLNGDGSEDILVGVQSGELKFNERNGSAFIPHDSFVSGISVEGFAKPTTSDLDLDGDLDIVVGDELGQLTAFINTGNASNPIWEKNDEIFPLRSGIGAHAAPIAVDPDKDGLDDFIIGSERAGLVYLKNTGGLEGINSLSYEIIPFSNAGNPFRNLDFVFQNDFITPLVKDLDNDGFFELMIGSESGGIKYYYNNGVDFQAAQRVEDEQSFIPFIIGAVIVVILSIVATTLIVRKRAEVRGTPLFLMVLSDTGIAPYQFKFSKDINVDIILAGGALVGIQNVLTEITGDPDLKTLDSGQNKILITKHKLGPHLSGDEIQVLIWTTADDPTIREAATVLANLIIESPIIKSFESGAFDEDFEQKLDDFTHTAFEKWLSK